MGLGGPHQEGGEVFGLVVQLVGVAVVKLDVLTIKRRRHGDPATGEGGVFIEHAARFLFLLAGVTGQDADDILGATDAFEELVDAGARGAVEGSARFGHQRQIGRALRVVGGELVVRRQGTCGTFVVVVEVHVGRFVVHGELGGKGAHLLLGKVRAALIRKGADGDVLQAVTACADLGVDFQTALELVLIKGAKRPFEGKVHVVDFPASASSHGRTSGQAQHGEGGEGEFLEHFP